MLEINGVDVYYGAVQALWKVSFKADAGEVTSVVGSNGAGKTTILKAISGLMRPTSGSIEFLGERIDELPPHHIVEKGVAHIPEGRMLFPLMTVLENLMLGAYTREAKKKRDETLEWIFQIFPILKERKRQQARTLSGGEQQMLAIGRGLMSKPKLLMLDEPSLGLAPNLVSKTFEVIRELNEQEITILLVEQNVHKALEIADRAFVLENGRVKLEGTGKEFLNNDYVRKVYLGIA